MGTPPLVALVLLLGALPACAWAAYSDLSRMKIPNRSVLLLAGAFGVLGLALLPLQDWTFADWAWRWAHLVAVLSLGMILNAARLFGAGDAKLLAAAAPFVALADWQLALSIFLASLLGCWLLHRLAMVSGGRRLAPDWVSWSTGKRFPMGVAIGTALVAYLALAAAA
jgi:prepilin peptidase CpaA